MPGNPRRRNIIAELTRRAAALDGPGTEPIAALEHWIASGRTISALAADLSRALGTEVSPATLYSWIHRLDGGAARLARARAVGAHGLVDTALAITDAASTESREELTHAKMRADMRLWIAERWNRAELGARTGADISVGVAVLHLDALRVRAVPAATISATVEDAEVLSLTETTG